MIEYMRRKLDENEKSNAILALSILTLIGSAAAIYYHLTESLSRWPSGFFSL